MKLFLFAIIFSQNLVFAKIYNIPIYDQPREPLVIIKDGKYSGLYIDFFEAILNEAKIEYKFIPMSNERRRQAFIDGLYVIECCANESWRTKSEEIKIQKFSNSFFTSRDIFIFSDDKFSKVKESFTLQFALVKGFDYGGYEDIIKHKFYLSNESKILEFMYRNRAQAAIIEENVFDYSRYNYPKFIKGKLFKESELKIRINKNEVALLNDVNKAIKSLKAKGTFETIKRKYLGDIRVRLPQNQQELLSSLAVEVQ